MSYAESLLSKDEVVRYRARQHWLAPVGDCLRPALLVLAGLVLMLVQWRLIDISGTFSTIWMGVWAILLLVGLGWIAIVVMTWRAQEYLITNRRVLKVEGLLDKKSGDSSLEKINDALLAQGILGRILHFGDLSILTANETTLDKYEMLSNVVAFKKAMLNAKNELEDGHRPSGPDDQPAPASRVVAAPRSSSADEVTGTLAKLADLRDKGAITPAEYEAKKAELLGRL